MVVDVVDVVGCGGGGDVDDLVFNLLCHPYFGYLGYKIIVGVGVAHLIRAESVVEWPLPLLLLPVCVSLCCALAV